MRHDRVNCMEWNPIPKKEKAQQNAITRTVLCCVGNSALERSENGKKRTLLKKSIKISHRTQIQWPVHSDVGDGHW
ncbi:hypothetical protein TNCV_4480861 [Trichonephila clavipes]|nr:hypothetical protein TNCV_4480861 [Trichonephila clavipes]